MKCCYVAKHTDNRILIVFALHKTYRVSEEIKTKRQHYSSVRKLLPFCLMAFLVAALLPVLGCLVALLSLVVVPVLLMLVMVLLLVSPVVTVEP